MILTKKENEILRKGLYHGLKPNTQPPDDPNLLLAELHRLEHCMYPLQEVEKEYLKVYREVVADTKLCSDRVLINGFLTVLFLGIVCFINAFNHSPFLYILSFGILANFMYDIYKGKRKAKQETKWLRDRFASLYQGIAGNFVEPQYVSAFPELRVCAGRNPNTDYKSLKQILDGQTKQHSVTTEVGKRLDREQQYVLVEKKRESRRYERFCPRCERLFHSATLTERCPHCKHNFTGYGF